MLKCRKVYDPPSGGAGRIPVHDVLKATNWVTVVAVCVSNPS